MDQNLLKIIACPICHSNLLLDKNQKELICTLDALAFPIWDGIPILLENKARSINFNKTN